MLDLDLTLWQARFAEYLEVRHFSPRTVEGYTRELGPFFAFLEEQGIARLADITREVVEAYRTALFYAETHGRRLCVPYQARRLSCVKTFLRFLARERYLLMDPGAGVELPRLPRLLPRQLLTEEEVEQLLNQPDVQTSVGLRNRAILEVLYSSAVRNSELRLLRLAEVDLQRQELHITFGKGGKSRIVPLGEEATVWLGAWLREGRPRLVADAGQSLVFVNARGDEMTRQCVSQMVHVVAQAAGLDKRVNPHQLRHCCATHMLRQGAGLRQLQTLLGHASPSATQRYTRVEISDLKEVHRRCHPRERGRS